MKTLSRLGALAALLAVSLFAQSGALLPTPQQFFDANGYPLAGGLVYTCVAGSTCGTSPVLNPLVSYTDSSLGTANQNPVVLDASGSASIWGGASAYKIVVETSAGVVLHTADNVILNGIAVSSSLSGSGGAALVGYQASGSSTTRTVAAKLGDVRSVTDFGAVGDGVTSNNTAFAAAATWANSATGKTLFFPDGTYAYSAGLAFTLPVTLQGGQGAVLNYSGAGNAVTMGPAGLTVSTYQDKPYIVDGLTFTGGASMVEGIYFNEFIVQCRVFRTRFFNFGNSAAADVWFQGENWDGRVDHISIWTESSGSISNGVWVNAADPANGTAGDNGQSNIRVTNSLIQTLTAGGVGIYLNGFKNAVDENTNVSGFTPNIRLGAYANGSLIHSVYMETVSGSAPCIQYGDASGVRAAYFVEGVEVSQTYCNVHNTDFSTTAHFIGPSTATTGMQNWRVDHNKANNYAASQPLVVLNNSASQVGNEASLNRFDSTSVLGLVHTAGGSINYWTGFDEVLAVTGGLNVTGSIPTTVGAPANTISQIWNQTDSLGNLAVRCGLTAQQYCGSLLYDYANNVLGGMQASGSSLANRSSILGPAAIVGGQVLSTGQFSITHGIDASGGGMKVIVGQAVGCTTAASIGAACTSSALAFGGTAFPDTVYSLTCNLSNTASGQAHVASVTKSVGSYTVTIAADTATAATGSVDCLAVHN